MFRLGEDHDVLGKGMLRPDQTLAVSFAQKLQEAGHALSVQDVLEPPGTAHNEEHGAGPARRACKLPGHCRSGHAGAEQLKQSWARGGHGPSRGFVSRAAHS